MCQHKSNRGGADGSERAKSKTKKKKEVGEVIFF
jgi:hypothetical protein